jgi:coenzyme F420 hydrogenase subunit beta
MGRSEKGEALLEEMAVAGRLEVQPLEEEAAVGMHSHMLDFKKRGAFLRMDRRSARGQAVPEYGFRPTFIPWQRRAFEYVLAFIFWTCSLRISRWSVEHFPVRITGRLFEQARQLWKRLTRTTKRKGLGHVEFEIDRPGGRDE